MVDAAPGIREARLEVVRLQVGHLVENLGRVETGGEKIKNVADANPHPANTRTPPALLWVDGDSVK